MDMDGLLRKLTVPKDKLGDRWSSAHEEAYDGNDEENDKKDISDVSGRTRYSRKAKNACNDRDYQKCYSPTQHDTPPSDNQ